MIDLVKTFSKDPIQFTYISRYDPGWQMQTTHFENHSVVLYKAKRVKYLGVSEAQTLKEVIEEVLGGVPAKW